MVNCQITNQEKNKNYQDQFIRLKKAFNYEFYLEAISIEYAIVEDKLESLLRHGKMWDCYCRKYPPEKRGAANKMSHFEKNLCHCPVKAKKYFSDNLLAQIRTWTACRNTITHALLKQRLTREDLLQWAEGGFLLVKVLGNKTRRFNRVMDKETNN